jgi:hypothetical protein
VVKNPANVIGRATIEVNEQNKVVARCSYQSVGIKLAADKLNLIRGEQTMFSATLSGLDGVTGPVSMQLTNATPWTVRMEGGETQIITAQPEEFSGGVWTAKRTLTGVRAGGFSINAIVKPGGIWRGLLKACDGGTPASEPISDLNRGDLTASNRGLAGSAQNAVVKTEKIVLPEKSGLRDFSVDEAPKMVAAVLPDLTIKDVCLSFDSVVPTAEAIRVLVANIGSGDAGPFELGLNFNPTVDGGRLMTDPLDGFKAGEQRWLEYSPMCCGFVPTVHVINTTEVFKLIADPSYYQSYGPYDPRYYKVDSKITESTKANNTLTISKTEMKRCDAKTSLPRPALPKIEVIKPVRP